MSKCFYIAGYGRSGSTLFDTMLSNCDGYHGIGEASNIFSAIALSENCSCGEKIQYCPFWNKYLNGVDAPALNKEQRRVEGIFGWLFYSRAVSYQSFWGAFFKESDREGFVVVDSSKISRATIFRPLNFSRLGVETSIIHLYRSPDDLLSSLLKGSNKDIAKGISVDNINHAFLIRSFFGAFFANLLTFFAGKFLIKNYFFVRYEDLISRPVDVLTYIGVKLGDRNDFSNLSPGHAVSGNRMRQAGSIISLKPRKDEKKRLPFFYKHLFRVLRIFEIENSY